MGFSVSYIKEMYENAYNDAVRASNAQNLPLAKRRFDEAASYLRKLAQLDPPNAAVYTQRAERIAALSAKIAANIAAAQSPVKKAPAGTNAGAATPSAKAAGNDVAGPSAGEDMSQYVTVYPTERLTMGFDGVIGLDEAKEAVTEYVINPIRYPDAYNYNFIDNKYILLEGPPGTGKTTFAKAVAKEIEQPFLLVNVASLVNCYVGETGKIIDRVFAWMRAYAEENNCGVTVFFDEFDEIAKSRGGDDKTAQVAVPALLRNLEGMQENKNFLIIANTNCKEMLDAGILSRFRRRIYIPLPDAGMRERFFRDKLAQLEPEYRDALRFDELAAASEGYSGRTITQVCDDFLHYVGSVKAGLTVCDDLNDAMIRIIRRNQA